LSALDAQVGGFDLVIANAGVGNDVSGRQVDWARMHQIVKVNVAGAMATLTAVLPGMVERGRGQIVGVSSLAGLMALPRSATYSASKAFLALWLDSMRLDLEGTGVQVTAILPGFVKSEMTKRNKHPMPFLLETDDAVERMGRAIERGVKRFAFPWQTAALIGAAAALPSGVRALALKRIR
jgi:short-subunit dehydrogenase